MWARSEGVESAAAGSATRAVEASDFSFDINASVAKRPTLG